MQLLTLNFYMAPDLHLTTSLSNVRSHKMIFNTLGLAHQYCKAQLLSVTPQDQEKPFLQMIRLQ